MYSSLGEKQREEIRVIRSEGVHVNRREQIQSEAAPVLNRWQSGDELLAIRRRLRRLFGAGLFVILVQLALDPGGITGALISLWFLLSLPVAAMAACILVLLKDPRSAPEMWWNNGTLATVGLVTLAGFTRVGRRTPLGRAAWRLVFGTDRPPFDDYEFGTADSNIDLSAVAKFRRYVYYAILGSVGIILVDQAVRQDGFGGGVEGTFGVELGLAGWLATYVGLLVLGVIVGGLAAAMEL